jgi:hypothetical protein
VKPYIRTYLFREVIDQLTVDETVNAVANNLLTPERLGVRVKIEWGWLGRR